MNTKYGYLNNLLLLGGTFLFLIPGLQPLILLYFTFKKKENYQNKCSVNLFKKLFYILLFYLPILIIGNILSGILLYDFTLQSTVVETIEKKTITFYNICTVILIAPILEELYFRSLLIGEGKRILGKFWSIIVSSTLFSFVHLNILSSPTLFLLGILLGVVYLATRSIVSCIFIHSLFNTIMLLMIIYG